MLKKLVAASLALALLAGTQTADAALNAYLQIRGVKSGNVAGGVTQKGREGQIAVFSTTHEIVSPRDIATGQATGKRQHKPLLITKELDKSTPILAKMLVTNEVLSEVTLRFWRPSPMGGQEQQYFTVKLTNASIASIKLVQPSTVHADQRTLPDYEEVSFTYQKIEWTWVDGGITASDDWLAPR
jgi:type VI secretion system secreted protein Hcp